MANQVLSIVFMKRLRQELLLKFDESLRWKIGGDTETHHVIHKPTSELLQDIGFGVQVWIDRKKNRVAFEVARREEQKKRREELAESI